MAPQGMAGETGRGEIEEPGLPQSTEPLPMSKLLATVALTALPFAAAPVYANVTTNDCRFNGEWEKCEIAGSSGSFTVAYARDGKKINVEKVGAPYPCSDSTADECGKLLIIEPLERRITWGVYRVAAGGSSMTARSSRGNVYQFQF
ncbi:MAG: hypothetical protein NTV57_15875 [Cyanobacteria bacterium]|nr:hypothetical protein [Cyanobacteriota bacterium]